MQQMFGIDLCSKCNEPEEGGCGLGGWRHDDDAAAAVKNAVKIITCRYLQLQVQRQTSSVEQMMYFDSLSMTTHLFPSDELVRRWTEVSPRS